MKTILISAALAVFISGPAFSRIGGLSPNVKIHESKAHAEHRAAQLGGLAPSGVASCAVRRQQMMNSRLIDLRMATAGAFTSI
jgi:hypothetical protein